MVKSRAHQTQGFRDDPFTKMSARDFVLDSNPAPVQRLAVAEPVMPRSNTAIIILPTEFALCWFVLCSAVLSRGPCSPETHKPNELTRTNENRKWHCPRLEVD